MANKYSIYDFVGSLIDTDIYKLYVGQFAFHTTLFRGKTARFEFINRNLHALQFPPGFEAIMRNVVDQMSELRFSQQQREYLSQNAPFLGQDYLDFLQHTFRFKPNQVTIRQFHTRLHLTIEGPWEEVTYWEIPLMMIIIGLHNSIHAISPDIHWEQNTINILQQFEKEALPFSLFGTRRRFSPHVENKVTQLVCEHCPTSFISTSNPHLAHKFGVKCGGTNPHELYMAHASLFGYEQANYYTLLHWYKEYGTSLATAVTDTFTTDVFLKNFIQLNNDFPEIANAYSRFRIDSGNEKQITQKILTFWRSLKTDTKVPTIIYSNSIDAKKALLLHTYTRELNIPHVMGIGSYLTHTITGHRAKDIVIKMTHFDGKDVCKLTDDPHKTTGKLEEIEKTKKLLKNLGK